MRMGDIDLPKNDQTGAAGSPDVPPHHIHTLHIENFRAIRELDYHPHQINIITGQNNTGKSALLDAVYMNATGGGRGSSSGLSSEIYNIHIRANQAVLTSDVAEVTLYRSLEYCKKADPEIYRKIRNDSIEHITGPFIIGEEDEDKRDQYVSTILAYTDYCVTVSDVGYHVVPYFPKGKDILRKELDAIFGPQVRETPAVYSGQKHNVRDLLRYQLLPGPWTVYSDPSFVETIPAVTKVSYSEKFCLDSVGDKEIHLLEQFIKEHNLVKNIERLTRKNVLYRKTRKNGAKSDTGDIEEIPISAHGDGFIVLLSTLHALLQSENGILILEEPENYLHPRYLGVLIETLFTYCDRLNVQVFMATHSYDLIEGALEYPETAEEKEMLLISKMTSDGEKIEKFDYSTDEGLKVVNELSLDLRGI